MSELLPDLDRDAPRSDFIPRVRSGCARIEILT